MIACKKATTYTKGLNASWEQLFKSSSDIFESVDLIFGLKPSGGSSTILRDFCKIPKGNSFVG